MYWFLSLSFLNQILYLYIIAINIVSFFFFGLDKLKSQLNSRRVSEKTLWILSIIGGSAGALFGMYFFRHKTKKTSFQIVLAMILLIQILIVLYLFN